MPKEIEERLVQDLERLKNKIINHHKLCLLMTFGLVQAGIVFMAVGIHAGKWWLVFFQAIWLVMNGSMFVYHWKKLNSTLFLDLYRDAKNTLF